MKNCLNCSSIKSSKGNYCKPCGYKFRVRPKGLKYTLKKENPTIFKKGIIPWNKGTKGLIQAWNRGIPMSKESKKKLSNSLKGRQAWNKNLHGVMLFGEKHPNWKGNLVGYNALHAWIYKKLGKQKKCDVCGISESKQFSWHNIDKKYKRNLDDWQRLCAKCHQNIHQNWRMRQWRPVV